jgi:hypothetical protein
MLQVFHVDVAKVDQNVACCKCFRGILQASKYFISFQTHVLQAVLIGMLHMFHTCCKSMFQWFQLFQSYAAVSVILSRCCKYFI